MLEKVQRMPTKLVVLIGFKKTQLNLYRLEKQRLQGYLIKLFKLLIGNENVYTDTFFSTQEATVKN